MQPAPDRRGWDIDSSIDRAYIRIMSQYAFIAAGILVTGFLLAFGISLWSAQGEAYFVATVVSGLPHCF
jgi:hypothetical protein